MNRTVVLWVAVVVVLAGPLAVALVALPGTGSESAPLVVGGGTPAPAAPADPVPTQGFPQDAYRPWAERIAAVTGIPARAVAAYGHAEVQLASALPDCRLSWATLAGVAAIESDHGRFAGRVLGADGRPDRPIVGPRLDGTPGVAAIPDTDGGEYDGDREWDRAVGPLQSIPGTWRRWASDGDGDGASDPQDVDDAAVAAGRYLCSAGGDLSTEDGWHAAVLAYNASGAYAASVLVATNRYAEASRRA